MKNVITSLAAVLLVIWYSLSVIGFDIHTCSSSGQTYVATVVSGFSCEEIHPEHHHDADAHDHSGCGCCCSHRSDAPSLDRTPCCTDDFQVITLTGLPCQETDGDSSSVPVPSYCTPDDSFRSMDVSHACPEILISSRVRDIGPRNLQASYSVWRI